MTTSQITIGDISGFLQLSKSLASNLEITNFGDFISGLRTRLEALGALTPELDANLTLAARQLEAFPNAFETGQQTFVEYIDDLVARYPAETPLSDIPEFSSGDGDDGGENDTPDGGFDAGGLPYETVAGGYIKAIIDADRSAYTSIYDPATDTITVSGPGYNTAVTGVQRLAFNDGILAFDTDGSSGQVYRLYQAAFNRDPDTVGISHNIGLVDGAMIDVSAMADAFVASEEFQQSFGALSDTAYIQQLYLNVLDRAAEAAGLQGWLTFLEDANNDRGDILIGLAESQENHARTDAEVQEGIWLI